MDPWATYLGTAALAPPPELYKGAGEVGRALDDLAAWGSGDVVASTRTLPSPGDLLNFRRHVFPDADGNDVEMVEVIVGGAGCRGVTRGKLHSIDVGPGHPGEMPPLSELLDSINLDCEFPQQRLVDPGLVKHYLFTDLDTLFDYLVEMGSLHFVDVLTSMLREGRPVRTYEYGHPPVKPTKNGISKMEYTALRRRALEHSWQLQKRSGTLMAATSAQSFPTTRSCCRSPGTWLSTQSLLQTWSKCSVPSVNTHHRNRRWMFHPVR